MNMFKKNGGFTLVELIVVIAILAILAGVAVPAYTGYIAKAEDAATLQLLSSINTAVQGLAAVEGETVAKVVVDPDTTDAGYSITTLDVVSGNTTAASTKISKSDVYALTGVLDFSDKVDSATWSAGEWTIEKN